MNLVNSLDDQSFDFEVQYVVLESLLNNPAFDSGEPLKYRELGPNYSVPGDGAVDLRANITKNLFLAPGECVTVDAGFKIWPGAGTFKNVATLLLPRSGLSLNEGIGLGNFVGLVDKMYQGTIFLGLWNRGNNPVKIEPAQRVAQMMFIPFFKVKGAVKPEFYTSTVRGTGGIGHTGTA